MINIKELSVGNWVKFPHGIDKIDELCMWANYAASATNRPVHVLRLEPIEITPEILEKNGWKVNRDPKAWIAILGENVAVIHNGKKDETFVIIHTDSGEIRFPFRYIHQLQRAFSLCGIQKEIELL